jgi:D-alanyl-D-alanine carboxypeptidase
VNRLRFSRRYIVLLVGLAVTLIGGIATWQFVGSKGALPAHERPLVTVTEISAGATGSLEKDRQTAASPEVQKKSAPAPSVEGFLAAFELNAGQGPLDADYFSRMIAADQPYDGDRYLEPSELAFARKVIDRLRAVEAHVGHGRFNTLGFEKVFKVASDLPSARFSVPQIRFMRALFGRSNTFFDYRGARVSEEFLAHHNPEDLVHYPEDGDYLIDGEPSRRFDALKQKLGNSLTLMSGYRGHPKQMLLYLDKVVASDGNLSLASRNRAPAGYSYHFSGDFDIGDRRFGDANFSRQFLKSPVYQATLQSDEWAQRYPHHNVLGVRFEPWHIIGQ